MRLPIAIAAIAIVAACTGEKPRASQRIVSTSAATFSSPDLSRAESLYFAAEYDSAGAIWKASLATDSVKKDSAAQAHILMKCRWAVLSL